MDNNLFSIIGKRSSTSAPSGTIPSLLGRISSQQVIPEKSNERFTTVNSLDFVPSLQMRIAPSPSRQQQTLSQRVAPSTLLERIDPISTPKGKSGQSSTSPSLVSRTYPSNVATPMPFSPTESQRKQLSLSNATTHHHPRLSPQHNVTTSVHLSNNVEIISKHSTALSPGAGAPTTQAFIGACSHGPSSFVSAPESGPSTPRSLNPVTSNSSLPNLPIFQPEPTPSTPIEETRSSYIQPPIESQSTMTIGPAGDNDMDIDPIEDLTREKPPSSVANSTAPELLHLPPPFLPLLVPIGSPSYAFSSPIKSDGVTYDTLRFHMSSLWEESEAQAREWGEVAKQRACSRLNDIVFAIRSPLPIQMKRGREDDIPSESINLSEDVHVAKRQRVVQEEESSIQTAGTEQVAMSTATQEVKEHWEASRDEASDILQVDKPLVDEAMQIPETVHMHPSSPPLLLPPEGVEEEETASEKDEQDEEANAEAERRAAEERTRIAIEKAKEMRKNLDQELAIQRREQEREKQEFRRKKEELEREAQRLREDIIKRKGTKASALPPPNIPQASTVAPAGLSTTMRHPLPPKPAICEVNNNSGLIASKSCISPIVEKKKSPTEGQPPSTTYTNINVSTSPHLSNSSPMPTGNTLSLTNGNTSEGKSSGRNLLSMPANPTGPPLYRIATSKASSPLNQSLSLSSLLGKPNISWEINDGEGRKKAIREENKQFTAQTQKRASAFASSTENVFHRTTEGFNEVVSSQSVQDSLPVSVFDVPIPSSSPPTPTDTIQVSTPFPPPDPISPVKDAEKSRNIGASTVSSLSPITQVKREPMNQDDSATCSPFALTTFGPKVITNVESSETKFQFVGVASGSGNSLAVSGPTSLKVEPSVEVKRSSTPSLPMKRPHSPSEEPVVLKRRRDTSMEEELEYPETTAWVNPEVVQSGDKKHRQRDRTNRSPTSLPIDIPLETSLRLQRHSPDGHRRSRSRSRSLSREIDRAHTPPRGPDYFERYPPRYCDRGQDSRNVSPPRGQSVRRPRPSSPIYDHWSLALSQEEVGRTYPSERPHSSYRPEPQYRSKYLRPRRRSSSSMDRILPVVESSRPVSSGSRVNYMRDITPYAGTDRGNEFVVNQRPNYTVNKNPPPKPYDLLSGDNRMLVPSPCPPRFPAAFIRGYSGRVQPARTFASGSANRPGSSSSCEPSPDHTTKPSPPVVSPSFSLADRLAPSRGRGAPRGRGSSSPRTRRTKLVDRFSDVSGVGVGSLKDRMD